MTKYDPRHKNRFSGVGSTPRTSDAGSPPRLTYVPIVRSAILDEDAWRDMPQASADAAVLPAWSELQDAEAEAQQYDEDPGDDEFELPIPDLDDEEDEDEPSRMALPLPLPNEDDEAPGGIIEVPFRM